MLYSSASDGGHNCPVPFRRISGPRPGVRILDRFSLRAVHRGSALANLPPVNVYRIEGRTGVYQTPGALERMETNACTQWRGTYLV
jgi:hypothetical protein